MKLGTKHINRKEEANKVLRDVMCDAGKSEVEVESRITKVTALYSI